MLDLNWTDVKACLVAGTSVVLGVGLVGFGVASFAHMINSAVVDDNFLKATSDLENKRIELGESIATKVDVSNFDIASAELSQVENDYIFKAFGNTSVEEIVGLKENNYINVFFNISEDQAKEILEAVYKAQNSPLIKEFNSPEFDNSMRDANRAKFSESKNIEETFNACTEVYNAINKAVENAYSHKIEKVAETSAMNKSISQNYDDIAPGAVSAVDSANGFVHASGEFINAGAVTTSVSQVVKDEENDVSYFFVDTLQGREEDGNMFVESCRAKVEVQGTDLSQEEVYAKFINGEQSRFTEIIREKVGEKLGVVNNELQSGVQEIEMF